MSFDLTSILTGGAGGLLGIIGNISNTWLSIKQQDQQNKFTLAMLPLQLNADIERSKSQVALAVEDGAGKAFTASQQADKLSGRESPWAANVKAMIRPSILVILFCGTVAIVTSGNATVSMLDYVTQNVVTDLSMAISWYFGARASDKVMQGYRSKAL
jgi:hypothetical protein